MPPTHRRITATLAIAALALLIAAAAAAADAARSHRRAPCSPSKGALYPRVTKPCNGATINAGQTVTFIVRDNNPLRGKYPPYINLTNKPPKRGVLKPANGAVGFFDELKPVKGHSGEFKLRPTKYTFPGWWQATRGTYYIQVQQISASGSVAYSPVTTIHVR